MWYGKWVNFSFKEVVVGGEKLMFEDVGKIIEENIIKQLQCCMCNVVFYFDFYVFVEKGVKLGSKCYI